MSTLCSFTVVLLDIIHCIVTCTHVCVCKVTFFLPQVKIIYNDRSFVSRVRKRFFRLFNTLFQLSWTIWESPGYLTNLPVCSTVRQISHFKANLDVVFYNRRKMGFLFMDGSIFVTFYSILVYFQVPESGQLTDVGG